MIARLLVTCVALLVSSVAYAEAPLGMLPAPMLESERVVPLSVEATDAARELAAILGTQTVEDASAYADCVVPDGASTKLDTACIKAVAEQNGVGVQRLIAVAVPSESEVVAYSVRVKDGAPLRYATAVIAAVATPDQASALNDAMVSIAKDLRGAFNSADLFGIAPLLVMVFGGLLLLLLDAFSRPGSPKDFSAYFTTLVGLLTFYVAYMAWERGGFPYSHELFGGMFSSDRFSLFFAMVIGLGVAISAPLSLGFFKAHQIERGEFYPLVVLSAVGMIGMAQSTDLFVTFISLEVMSLGIYVLVGFMRHEKQSAEGAVKYFLLGAFSSGFLVYGIALVYGIVGATQYGAISQAIKLNPTVVQNPILVIGVFLILVAFLFKIAAIPFHMWTPDAYQAAPSPVTGFMAFGVKAAAFASMLRLFGTSFLAFKGEGFSSENPDAKIGWYALLLLFAVLTMVLGNVLALVQKNAKRVLAYSSIAHAGYLMIGLATMAIEQKGSNGSLLIAGQGVIFYLMVYGFSSLLAFGALGAIERHGSDLSDFSNLRGAARRHPGAGLAMAIAMLSFAGIPPTGGFFAKLVLFREALRSGNTDLLYLTIIGVLASVIGVYYYLKILVVMYMEEPSDAINNDTAKRPQSLYVALFAAASLVLYLGLAPGRYITLAKDAIHDMAQIPTQPAQK